LEKDGSGGRAGVEPAGHATEVDVAPLHQAGAREHMTTLTFGGSSVKPVLARRQTSGILRGTAGMMPGFAPKRDG
jgi:hypothetical protein